MSRDQLPPLPPPALAFPDEPSGKPGTVANPHVDPCDGRRAGPRDAPYDEVAGRHRDVSRRLGDDRAHLLQADRLAHDRAVALPLVHVAVRLEVAVELGTEELDGGDPLDGRDRIPPRNDEAQREPVLDGKRIAVHRVREQRARLAHVVERERALKVHRRTRGLRRSVIRATEQHVRGRDRRSRTIEHLGERDTRPFRRADGTETPLLAVDRRVERRTTVPRALQRHDERVRRHRLQLAQIELQRPLHESGHGEAPGRLVDDRCREVVAHVEARVRHRDAADQRGEGRLTIERLLAVHDEPGRRRR